MDSDPPLRPRKRLLILCATVAAIIGVAVIGLSAGIPSEAAAAEEMLLPKAALWGSLIFFLLLSGFFTGSETALFSLTKVQLHTLEQAEGVSSGRGRRGFRAIRRLLDAPNETLVTILACNTFANIAATLSGGALVESYVPNLPTLSFILGALLITVVILIFAEITPKTLAIERIERFSLHSAPVLLAISRAFTPVQGIATKLSHAAFRLLGVGVKAQEWDLTEEELKVLLTFGEVKTILEEDEQEMIERVLEFGETFVEEIMTPRTQIEGFAIATPQEEMKEKMKRATHSRVLIYKEDVDHVAGVLYAKDFLLDPKRDFRELLREPIFVPTRKRVIYLLKEFKLRHSQFAVVLDEYGGTVGIVTLHDLLEEIVGEIRDRGQKGTLEEIIRMSDEEFLVPGKSEIWVLNDELGLKLPEDMGRTLSGFIINSLGHFPKAHETVEHEGYLFRVLKIEHHRIIHVYVKKLGGGAKVGEEQGKE